MPFNLKDVYLEGSQPSDDLSATVRTDTARQFDIGYKPPTTYRESYLAEQIRESQEPSFTETLGLAIENEWVAGSLKRMYERSEGREYDQNFVLSQQQREEIHLQYSGQEIDYLNQSISEQDYELRKKDIQEDRNRNERLMSTGLGLPSILAANLLDPAALALTAATGGLYKVQQTGRVARVLQVAGLSAAENAAIEAALLQGDTQRSWDDVVLAGISGGVLGGTLGAVQRTRAKAKGDNIVESIDEIDSELVRVSQAHVEDKVINRYEVKTFDVENTQAVDSAIKARSMRLNMVANKRPMGDKVLKKQATRKRNAELEIASLKKQRITEIAEYWSKAGVNKGIHRHMDEARVDGIAARFDKLIQEQQDLLDKANMKLAENDRIFAAKSELRDWELMDRVKQVEMLFPQGTPQMKVKRKRTVDGMKKAKSQYIDDAIQFEEKFKQPETTTGEDIATGSVGAAKTKPELVNSRFNDRDLEAEDEWLEAAVDKTEEFEETVGKNWTGLPEWLMSDSSILSKAESIEVRALANMLMSNPQTGKFGRNVSTLVRLFDAQIRKAGQAALDSGFDKYLDEIGEGRVGGYVNPSTRNEFELKVALGIKGKLSSEQLSESVQQTVDKVKNQLKVAGDMRKDAGELGFENITTGGNYFPDIMSREGLSTLVYDMGWGKVDVKELIAKGYRQGNNEISEKQARLLAHVKYDNWAKGQLYDGDVHAIYRAASASEAEQLLKKANVPQELIDDFFADVLSKEDWKQVSNRARKSLQIDWDASHTVEGKTVKIADIMNTNVSQVLEAYTKESAYGSAMARMGIRSEGMLNRVITQARTQALEYAEGKKAAEVVKDQFKRIDDVVTILKGRPLVDYTNEWNKRGRMLLDATAILRLQQAGFASIGDLARSIQMVGIKDILSNVRGSGAIRNPFNRMQGRTVQGFKNIQDDMEEIEEMLGFFEEDNFHMSFTSRSEEFGSDAKHALGKKIENSIEGVKRISQWMNLFNTIQGGISKISARAVNRRLIKDALGQRELPTGLRQELLDTGMTEQRWKEISEWVKQNHSKGTVNGREVPLWNFDAMDKEMKLDLQVAMSRIHTRNVQRGIVGETNSDWFGPYSRFFTQFKSHSLISIEKQLVHDMRGDLGRMAGVTMYGTGLAMAAYFAQMNLRALGMPADKREEYLEENTTGAALAWGVINKHSQMASVGLVADLGVFSGALPQDWFDSTRYGYQHGRLDSLIPAAGVLQDGAKALGSGLDIGFNQFREEPEEDAVEKFAESTLRVMPLSNSIYFGEYIKNVSGLSED